MIVIKNVTLRRGTKIVLQDASVTLQPGEKVGLVGRNGAGKSSLFSLLTHRLQSDAGDVSIPPRWLVGEVAQSMPETDDSATDYVLEGDTRLNAANAALAAAEAADDGHAMAEAHQLIAEAGGFEARPRAQALLMGLGFRVDQVDDPVNSFSGGWRMRLQLARALMCPADLMLLDEPTNHLDLDALVWLEAWLQRYEGTMIVISHDREFLDAITKVTLHLDETRLTRYTGNYTAFEEMRAERMMQAQANFAKQQERMAHLQKFIDRFKAKASKAKQAQSRVKALARMEKLGPVLTSSDFQFEFREPVSLPNPMLAFSVMSCGYAGVPIVSNVNRSVLAGQRIGILGANGQGKSTLVKTIAKEIPLVAGEVTEGKGLSIGYFAQQELDVLSLDDGPLMHMIRLARDVGPQAREQELRDFLGSFRFVGEMVTQAVGSLSGGEKARLVLAMLVWQRPNLLLLDEPTNHLDLTTREALSMALNEFEGTVMLVSHDRALLREVCDEFWLVTGGAVKPFDGDLDDYQKWLLETSREMAKEAREAGSAKAKARKAEAAAAAAVANPPKAGKDDRKAGAQLRQKAAEQTKPLRTELATLEKRIATLTQEKTNIAEASGRADLSPAQRVEQGKRLKQLGDELEAAEGRWLEVTGELDALGA
ncbi:MULTISPECIES: ABC-F family ATP-binding cassette domain-containing protein [unclassified Rhizobacter]|uniref:ABC-F family ATP-binding cassette domain-containing protein n=1 Tax=unclassified Rhizobacter TaxID=2640088 RepID=UPI0006FB9B6B|nr:MULTISPECIES: ATP-binding cassette domain-containing protein [unclassified Rhizobacter]KQU74418.1 ABC transporter [Rhizobacter sp. Root29]KQW00527.1 ABC transporter [Rhizobacter sp. Root1238]KRB09447.1 ABC transporter [Rhizobacter sp. Root16D2]